MRSPKKIELSSYSPLDPAASRVMGRHGYSDAALRDIEHAARSKERDRALGWLGGLYSPSGVHWAKQVRSCGAIFPARLPDGRVVLLPMTCKTRACPRCMVDRARNYSARIREAAEARSQLSAFETAHRDRVAAPTRTFVFVTVTQRKTHIRAEDCAGSLDRFFDSWKRLTNTKSRKRNAVLRSMIVGGLRSLECVWSPQGKANRNGGRVRYSGWHTHGHCIMEIRVPVAQFAAELRRVWAWSSPRSDPYRGVDVQPLDNRMVGELSKYLTKPFQLPDTRARELFTAAHSRRFLVGFGEWRGWQKWAPERESKFAGAVFGSKSITNLVARQEDYDNQKRGSYETPLVSFERWEYDEPRKKRVRVLKSVMERADMFDGLRESSMSANMRAQQRADQRCERLVATAARKKKARA